ncbi:MAG TPA: TIGR02265 family protein [Methylomirabilota bacterium]|nr:TIGR02265 family protein [Methylomirabilota bacterium]
MSKQKVKGSVLKSRLEFVRKDFGEAGLDKVLDSLSDDDRKALGRLVAVTWVDFDVGKRLDDAIVKMVGGGSTRFFERLGEASAEVNLASLHSAFLAPGDPQAFLAKAPQIYRLYYDVGWREYHKTGEREGVLTTHEAETFSKADCLTVIGWYRRALEMCGARNVRIVEEECRSSGGSVCRYRVSWQ